ncbi:MAG: hypothetical protein UT67_C0001G0045 [Candidatus Magasanikbacteria bacterium GW2011_GWA2_40_10]|uniref:Outer membrane protein beta-barrel domain-containing protein n=1 Tax=Candidatus Magasanikbacteria bacterium GW2011_GWA2_40_10 TaxID=1619037 RepID=A0A0G0SLA5_9BACT|nr:MAG: hypothetical protein UT67_C0001G0045 [Candidatus Magasanikbacteria bacterium GW2011_GWA2_40_10]
MKNRSLALFAVALSFGLSEAYAFADDEVKEPVKAKVGQKRSRKQIASCGLYSSAAYLTGKFNSEESNDSLARTGGILGASCSYNNRSPYSFGIDVEMYGGKFHFNHDEESIRGSVSYVEMGFTERVKASIETHGVKIGLMAGVQKTVSNRFKVDSLEIKVGGGWFEFKDLAAEHLSSSGDLEIWQAGLDVEFPLPKHLAITFGAMWQRYVVDVSLKLDDEGKDLLETLHYDIDKVERDFNNSANFFYIHPGIKWCWNKFCASLDVDWGIFKKTKWSGGVRLTVGAKF